MQFIFRLCRKFYLLWPILAGLATAYVLAGYVEYSTASYSLPGTDVHSIAPAQDRTSWESLIFEKNILNLEIPSEIPEEPPETDSGTSPVDWKLLGVFTGKHNLALIQTDEETKLLNSGQELHGWKLKAILPRSTLWTSDSQSRYLDMWQETEEQQTSRQRDIRQTEDSSGSHKVGLSQKDVQPVLQDPNNLLQMAHFQPYTRQGEMQGFQVNNIQRDSLLQQLGLRNGDILTRIDGQPITGPTELLKAYSQLDQSRLVTMDVLRRGQNVNFVLEIE